MEGSGSSRWLAAAATAAAAALITGCRAEPPPAESEVLRRRRVQELLSRTDAEGSVDARVVYLCVCLWKCVRIVLCINWLVLVR